jgi:BirA family biotin operon repressor/biotin-[acetyl-CoA-carboxylase] ligase
MPGRRFSDVRRLATVDSTNRYLLDVARAGAADGVVAVADHQTAGRGRQGRTWEAPPGSNLLVSVLLRPRLPAERRPLAGTAVALAVVDAVADRLGVALGLKWPNDLLAPDGRKVAGVLAEADVGGPTGPAGVAVVVGVGINVNWPADDDAVPPDLVGTATSLRGQLGRPVDRDDLLSALLDALEARAAELDTGPGRARLGQDFARRCTTLGTAVRVELADGVVSGTATSLTPDGHLVVTGDGAPRTVVAGDVIHLRPGP